MQKKCKSSSQGVRFFGRWREVLRSLRDLRMTGVRFFGRWRDLRMTGARKRWKRMRRQKGLAYLVIFSAAASSCFDLPTYPSS